MLAAVLLPAALGSSRSSTKPRGDEQGEQPRGVLARLHQHPGRSCLVEHFYLAPVNEAFVAGTSQQRVWPLWAAGKLRVFTCRKFPLAAAADAHRLMESSRHIGKILLVP